MALYGISKSGNPLSQSDRFSVDSEVRFWVDFEKTKVLKIVRNPKNPIFAKRLGSCFTVQKTAILEFQAVEVNKIK